MYTHRMGHGMATVLCRKSKHKRVVLFLWDLKFYFELTLKLKARPLPKINFL